MALHRLASVTIGVPNTAETAEYYTEFGLQPDDEQWFATQDGGRQLRLVHAPPILRTQARTTLTALRIGQAVALRVLRW